MSSETTRLLRQRYPDYDAATHTFVCPTHGPQTLDAHSAYRLAHQPGRCCPQAPHPNNLPQQSEPDWPARLQEVHPHWVLHSLYRDEANNLVADLTCPNGHDQMRYLQAVLRSEQPCPRCKNRKPREMRRSQLTLIKQFA